MICSEESYELWVTRSLTIEFGGDFHPFLFANTGLKAALIENRSMQLIKIHNLSAIFIGDGRYPFGKKKRLVSHCFWPPKEFAEHTWAQRLASSNTWWSSRKSTVSLWSAPPVRWFAVLSAWTWTYLGPLRTPVWIPAIRGREFGISFKLLLLRCLQCLIDLFVWVQ